MDYLIFLGHRRIALIAAIDPDQPGGISRWHLAKLTAELGSPWQAEVEGRRHSPVAEHSTARRCGARHRFVFVGR